MKIKQQGVGSDYEGPVELKLDEGGRLVKIIYRDGKKSLTIESDFKFTHELTSLTQDKIQDIMFEIGKAVKGFTAGDNDDFIVATTDMLKPDHLNVFHKGLPVHTTMEIIGQVPDEGYPASPTDSIGSIVE